MAQTKAQKWADVFQQAQVSFEKSVSASEDQREQSLEDRRFYSVAGAQWEGAFGEAFANKTQLELNKVNLAVYRVINEWRGNRITVDFLPKDGTSDDALSDLCDGLFRADEQDSQAAEAYDVAFEEMCSGGYGAWRLCAEYEDEYDEDSDAQRIRIEPIHDADRTVFWDSNARLYDKSDAAFCFVLTPYARQAYEDEFGDDPSSWAPPIDQTSFDWFDGDDNVYVAEYYKIEDERYKVRRFKPVGDDVITIPDEDLDDEKIAAMSAVGTVEIGEKMVKRRRVRKYIMSGGGVLEDCGYIAGKHIPVIPAYGKRSIVGGLERWAGVVRYAKDAQRLYNMQISYLADIAARGGYRKPILAPEQVAGHESIWASDAEQNYAYLTLNPITNADGSQTFQGPLAYTEPPDVPSTMGALIQIVGQDIFDILGNQEAGDEVDTQLSGKAVEMIQSRLDQQAVIYMDNFAKSVRREGEVWLSMASDLYSEEGRKMKTVDRAGEQESVVMNEASVFDEDGRVVKENDLSRAKMDIFADVGPTSSTKRSATVRALSSLLPVVADPADQKVLSAMIMMNMEGEGIGDVRDYFRRQMVQMGVVEPTEEEQAGLDAASQQAKEPSPQDQYLMSEAQKNASDAKKNEAQTIESLAKAEKAKAEAAETLAGIEISQRDSVVSAVEKLSNAGPVPPQNGTS